MDPLNCKPKILPKPKFSATNVVFKSDKLSPKNQRDTTSSTELCHPNCSKDCCGMLQKQLECKKNNKNGLFINDSTDGEMESNLNKTFIEQLFQTSSQSFDSSSSSTSTHSGGFKDFPFVTKTKVAYETFDKKDLTEHEVTNHQITNKDSKVQEIQKKMLAKQQQQNHTSNELSIVINRQSVQNSSRELEKVLGSRLDRNLQQKVSKSGNKFSKNFDIRETDSTNVSLQIQKKLTEEMKKQCEMIKEKFLDEKTPVQQHYNLVIKIRTPLN